MRILPLLLLLLPCSCKKKPEPEIKCYECDMTYASGIPAGKQYPCTADITQWQRAQSDTNGDPIQSVCKEK